LEYNQKKARRGISYLINYYIDESGSICNDTLGESNRWFTIAVIRPLNIEKLQRVFKRYISSRLERLKACPHSDRIFNGDDFHEIKGSALTPELKRDFMDFFCKNSLFEVYFIRIDNTKTQPSFCNNKARSFNYDIKLTLISLLHRNIIPEEDIYLHIDERNVRTETKATLEEYLNTELQLNEGFPMTTTVEYHESSSCRFVQIADVFSNIFFSSSVSESYQTEIRNLCKNGYIKFTFEFPLS
jgi:hypothetical protein